MAIPAILPERDNTIGKPPAFRREASHPQSSSES